MAQAYSRSHRRLSPSLANRLRIGFAIGFAVLTAMAVIGVARFIQQRQDFENSIARSYQVEMLARERLARGTGGAGAKAIVTEQIHHREQLQDDISGDTRDTALLVAAGLIAGLTGALLLFSGLISSMRRPLEELVNAAGRLAAGDRSARVEVGGLSETAALGAAFNEMARELEIEEGRRDELDRLKDEFVLTASHELRSPLTSVQGFAELLMLDKDSLTPRQRETVEIILDNCRHLVRLLNDLLDLARSDAGRLSIRPQPTEVAPLVEDVVRTIRAQTEASGQTLTEQVEPNLPLIDVEADRIRQILVNLLTNAHEYTPEGASIGVAARAVGAEVEISVSDDGPGIPPDQLERIFERFTRGDAGLTQRVGGTGLGLAISKSLVELHGGSISAESTVGQGSTFHVRLPVAAGAALDGGADRAPAEAS
ncbi:MAG TPA: HAMP domain-containing sensor histidine kinase [Solirubrobacterales bacterium]|nr:HAMP domain-containing sensor histidine kinase [Solirubrobacterales bacterium]